MFEKYIDEHTAMRGILDGLDSEIEINNERIDEENTILRIIENNLKTLRIKNIILNNIKLFLSKVQNEMVSEFGYRLKSGKEIELRSGYDIKDKMTISKNEKPNYLEAFKILKVIYQEIGIVFDYKFKNIDKYEDEIAFSYSAPVSLLSNIEHKSLVKNIDNKMKSTE